MAPKKAAKPATPSRRRRRSSTPADDGDGDAAAPAAAAAATTPKRTSPRKRTKSAKAVAAEVVAAAEAAEAEQQAEGGDEYVPPKAPAAAAAAAAAAASDDDAAAAAPPKAKKTIKAHKFVPTAPVYAASMRPANLTGPAHRFISWNVAGARALVKRDAGALRSLVEREGLDAVCLQEHKLQEQHIDDVVKAIGLEGWHAAFACSTAKKGYSGAAIISKQKPLSTRIGIGLPEGDAEGRAVSVELPELWLVSVYSPNSGDGLKRLDFRVGQWDKALAAHIKALRSGASGAAPKPVVVLGDLNCAPDALDVYDSKKCSKYAGHTPQERESFATELLGSAGMVDAFRAQHPGVIGFTYFGHRYGMREAGKGWRLDYTLVSPELAPRVHDAYILTDVLGSDHQPLGLVIKKG